MTDIMEVIIKGVCAGQAVYNILHFRDENDQGPIGLMAEMESGTPNWFTRLVSCLCNDYSVSSILSRNDIDTTPGPQIETATSTTYTGLTGDSAGPLPPCGVIKWTTAVGGRSGRGRSYIGPPGINRIVDGLLEATIFANLGLFAQEMDNRFFLGGSAYAGNYTFGIWSRKLNLFRPATGFVPRQQAKTQRRRQLGVGI